jgi:hypothetical protein
MTTELITDSVRSMLINKPVWYVSAGGTTVGTFSLALGDKIRRQVPLRNEMHALSFREYEGEVAIYVWCAWRIDDFAMPVASWCDEEQKCVGALKSLSGATVEDVAISLPGFDLSLQFSNGFTLRVFCDHTTADTFDGNWEVRDQLQCLSFGPGAVFSKQSRADNESGRR